MPANASLRLLTCGLLAVALLPSGLIQANDPTPSGSAPKSLALAGQLPADRQAESDPVFTRSSLTYRRVRHALDQVAAIDTHDHLFPFDRLRAIRETKEGRGVNLAGLWRNSYLPWYSEPTPWKDGMEFDDWWRVAKNDFQNLRATSFYRYQLPAFRDLYGVDFDTITDQQARELNAKIFNNYRDQRWIYDVVTERANIELMFNDPAWDRYGFVQSYPWEVLVLNVTPLIQGFHPSEYEKSNTPDQNYSPYEFAAKHGLKVDSLDDYLNVLERLFLEGKDKGAVCLKTTVAYQRTLQFDDVPRAKAAAVFGKRRTQLTPEDIKAFEDFIMWRLCELSAKFDLPFQIHTGQARIQGSNPLLLVDLLAANPNTKFILFHGGYPWVGESAVIMQKHWRHCWLDSCWLPMLSYSTGKRAFHEWLDAFPSNRLMWGADCNHAEGIYGATVFTRQCLAEVLAEKVLAGDLQEEHALVIGKQVLRDNALELFPQLKDRLWKHTGKKLEPPSANAQSEIEQHRAHQRVPPDRSGRILLPRATEMRQAKFERRSAYGRGVDGKHAAAGSRRYGVPIAITRLPEALIATLLAAADVPAGEGTISFSISDAATKATTPCRIHLRNPAGQPVMPKEYPTWRDHFVCDGAARVVVPAGEYNYEIERGPEYRPAQGKISVKAGETVSVKESIGRIVDLARENWWSGEMHIHRPLADVPLLMRAEDLHIGLVITWWNDINLWKERPLPAQPVVQVDKDRFYDSLGGEDERGGGALLFAHLREPLPISRANPNVGPKAGRLREAPSSAQWLAAARDKGAWADAEKPFWRDFPLWLSTGQLNSVGVANNHMHRKGMLDNEAWGRPRDKARLPDPYGNGFWTQEIYYHALNSGFRLPPSAGSASGVLPNPVGYNRVYAHVDGELTWDKWWQSLREGRVFVTNGPLLRLNANGKLPGEVFKSNGPLQITLEGKLDSNDKIAAIELVTNGQVREISLPAKIDIAESGWFLVRARADVKDTFRFASTAPWYVEIGNSPERISRAACDFFLQWTDERIEQLKQAGMSEEPGRNVLKHQEQAKQFWTERRTKANAE